MHTLSLKFLDVTRSLLKDLNYLFTPVEGSSFRVIYDPSKNKLDSNQTKPGEIFIGVGERTMAKGPSAPGVGIILQHKGTDYGSVSDYVQHAAEGQIDAWRHSLGNPASLRDIEATLYIEDASPDTCLGFVLFLAQIGGVEREALPALWCDYATRWETGDTQTTGSPFDSWGCLHSALGHSFIAPQQDKSQLDSRGVEASFPVCLRYVLFLLTQQLDPSQIPEYLPSMEHSRARAHLQQEHQAYRQSLTSAELLQLRVPMRAVHRTLLIDAYFATEVTVSGVKKAFLRNDTEHCWLKQGFSLMALYRPLAKGTGDDIIVSVTPSTDIHLKELWYELERQEDQRWEGQRPCDDPRPGVADYSDGSGPNQPWWDEGGRYTLIAAPRNVGDQPGSKLSWDDVRETIWSLYNPAKHLRFIPDGANSNAPRPLHQCPAVATSVAEIKRLVIARWDETNDDSLALSPTMKRYMGACAMAEHPHGVTLRGLPSSQSFDFCKLPGGFAVIHGKGVLLIDDWTNEPLNKAACQQEFEQVARLLERIRQSDEEITTQVQQVRDLLEAGHRLFYMKIISQLSRSELKLRSGLFDTRPLTEDENVLAFRRKLEKRWGIKDQLANLNDIAGQMNAMVQNHVEVRSNHLINGLTIYGFPIILFATFFERIFGSIPAWHFFGIQWFPLIIYLLLISLGVLSIRLMAYKLNRLGKNEVKNMDVRR